MKRSTAISFGLLAGCAFVALRLAESDPSQKEEDALIYRSAQDCAQAHLRSDEDCSAAYREARATHLATATRYADKATCEDHHGWANCEEGATAIGPAAAGAFVPVMTAYLLARSVGQDLPIQPLYNHAERSEESGTSGSSGGGGYCTAAGGRVYPARGGVSRVASSVARTTSTTPRIVARGGFGGTGHSVSAAGFGGGHGSTGS